MKLEGTHYGFLLLFCLGYLIADFSFCHQTEEEVVHVRHKRSLICMFGLPRVLKNVLYSSLNDVQNYDPLPLGNTEEDELENGVLKGLSTLKNLTELKVYCNEDSNIVLATTLGMKNAEILYYWNREFVFMFSGTVWMRAKEVNFELEIHIITTDGLSVKVVNSLLSKLNVFRFGFTGLGPLNPVVVGTVNIMYKIWRRKVTAKIENLVKETLEKKLQEVAQNYDFLAI